MTNSTSGTGMTIDPDRTLPELRPYEHIRIGGIATACGNEPIDAPLFSEIIPGIWTGGSVAEWDMPMPTMFRHILNFYPWMEYDVPAGANYKELRMLDAHHIDKAFLEEAAEFIDNAATMPGDILIHCQAGINRSNLALAYWLVTRKGWVGEEAIHRIRQRRCTTALCNPAFESFVRDLRWA